MDDEFPQDADAHARRVRRISLLLQRLDHLADRPADHPKDYDAIASAVLEEIESP